MEYFIGSVVAIGLIILLNIFTKRLPTDERITIQTSQSYLFSLMGNSLALKNMVKPKPTQASKHLEKMFVRILIVNGKAYWIKDNVFYVADVEGEDIDKANAKKVDIMSMDKVQLEEAMFIIDKLKEDSHDSWDSGK